MRFGSLSLSAVLFVALAFPPAARAQYTALEPAKTRAALQKLRDAGLMREMKFMKIPGGTFDMGRYDGDGGQCQSPIFRCGKTWIKPFELQETEVTKAQWMEVMGNLPTAISKDKADDCPNNFMAELGFCPNRPVASVTFADIAGPGSSFVDKLNALRSDGCVYKLPTDAQWEYAARAGNTTQYACGDDPGCMKYYAVAAQNGSEASPVRDVGSLLPNPLGLYDMYGNVAEWVADGPDPYAGQKRGEYYEDPRAPIGTTGLARGGSSGFLAERLPAFFVQVVAFNAPDPSVGFRLARKCPSKPARIVTP